MREGWGRGGNKKPGRVKGRRWDERGRRGRANKL